MPMQCLARLGLISCRMCVLLLVLSGCGKSPEAPPASDQIAVLETHIQALSPEDDAVRTRFGNLEMVRSHPDTPPDTLKLDGEQLFEQEGFYLFLHQYLKRNERDLVLFSSNCGGTACTHSQFYFLLLAPDTQPSIITAKDFVAYPDDVELSVDSGQIILDLGFQAGKHKQAILQNDKLSIKLETVAKSFLGEENCRWLYDEALGTCRDYKETDPSCRDPQASFEGYLMRGVAAVSEHPGFMQESFERRCKIACESAKIVDYPTFAKEVCSK